MSSGASHGWKTVQSAFVKIKLETTFRQGKPSGISTLLLQVTEVMCERACFYHFKTSNSIGERPDGHRRSHGFLSHRNRTNPKQRPPGLVFSDAEEQPPLTRNSLLLLWSTSNLRVGSGINGNYSRRRGQANHLANTFWMRCLEEYLPTLRSWRYSFIKKLNFVSNILVLGAVKTMNRDHWPQKNDRRSSSLRGRFGPNSSCLHS